MGLFVKFGNLALFSRKKRMIFCKKKTPPYYRWRKRNSFYEKQSSAKKRVVRINKALVATSIIVLVSNQRLLVVVAIIGEFQLNCRDIAINNGSGIIRQEIHLELHCRIQCLQFLHNSNADVFH